MSTHSSSNSSSSSFNTFNHLNNSSSSSSTSDINESQRGDLNARKAAAKRKRWTDMKTTNPEKYAESLAKMRQYHQKTRVERLAKQKEYRRNMSEQQKQQRLFQQKEQCSNMSEEQIENNRMKRKEKERSNYREMRDAEEQLDNASLLDDETDLQGLQRLANRRQQLLANKRSYKSKKWANIPQEWYEDFPCR